MKTLRLRLAGALLLMATFLVPINTPAQDAAGKRRLLDHAAPAYPPLARDLGLSGVVKIEVLVAPDGSVKSGDIRGGHPVLAQAAMNAVRRWKWEPAARESKEEVQVKFSRQD